MSYIPPMLSSPEPLVLEDDYTVAPRSHPVSHPPVDAPLCVTCRSILSITHLIHFHSFTILFVTHLYRPSSYSPTLPSFRVFLFRHLDLSFFDPSCPGCSEILKSRETSIGQILAIMRQCVPQTQHNIDKAISLSLTKLAHLQSSEP